MGSVRLVVAARHGAHMSTALEDEAAARYPYKSTQGVDHKAWAKRFLYREERGDKTLLAIQVKFARMAMDIKDEVTA